ncbi:hypothetical protein DUI87_30877 [Hirundo rustica rustica]|uniref:ribonuclease H n=1 Tax=Hirundo rustica rustica TaxID=333673 RepID=A0A3M0ITM8_HIRRU|nr:hypothetical protein DUI87_30877 [Hirundo rustica rustica]
MAAVEKQVSDPVTRKLMIQSLAQGNCNAVCKRIIEALPGEPSMSDMVGAYARFGKRDVERKGETRADTNVSASAPTNGDLLSRLAASTRGSAGVDVCTAESVVIDSDKIHKVPLGAFGPLGDGMSAFLMGRSSATIQGIMEHLGLIDADFSGQIHAMVSRPTPPLTIPKGTRIAQLVPFKSSVSRTEDRSRGDSGFGSTGPPQVRWTAVLTKGRPETLCTVSMVGAMPSEIHLRGLLGTGADVSILSLAAWPPQWPLSLAKTSIVGLGGTKQCYVSRNPVAITNPEGKSAIIWPYVTEIAQNLWGRDVLAIWGGAIGNGFLIGATVMKGAECPTPPLWWLVDRPIWENQWPLPHDKLNALRELVQEQLDQGHLEPSTSPWNTPVFCIKKKSGKWRLLQDLRKINAVMEGMGTLQAGMPSPTMLPADWPVLIVDLKDWFFTIPLHPDDRPKFAFMVPTINNAKLAQRYQWKVLPQGMRNSPVLCQWYVARALSGVRKQFPDAHVYHYMDDILVAMPTQDELLRIQPQLLNPLHSHGLQVAPEKVQQQPPWKYLGVKILERTIRHQEVQFVQSVKTLNDAQKQVGVITWLHPYLGLTTAQLSPLFELLKGDTDLKSPCELNPEARKVLEEVQQAVSACQVYRIEPSIDVTVFITTPDLHPTGEKARDVIAHWRQAFAVLGIPSAVKTDNGPAYASQQALDGEQQPRAKVRVRNLVTKQWEGPYDLIAMGRGYACVSTDTGKRWDTLATFKSTEATALSALAPSASGEEAKEEPKEGNYCLIPAGVTAQLEYSKPGSVQHLVEQQDVEHSGDVSAAVTPTSAGAESGAHKSLSPSADEPLFLNAAEHMHTEVVKEAVLVAQRPLEEPEDPCEQKQRGDEEMGAKARAAEAESPAYVPHSPRADGLVLLDTAQSMAASAEGTESPGHTVHSQTADAPLFLHHRDFLQTEMLKRAVLMVQEPLE